MCWFLWHRVGIARGVGGCFFDRFHKNENPHDQQTERILRELNELKQCLTLMLEDKQAQDTERRRQEAEREQLHKEIEQLRQALEQEKKRGFWARLFSR